MPILSINLRRSIRYGLGVLRTCADYRLNKYGLAHRDYLDFEPGNVPSPTSSAAPTPAPPTPAPPASDELGADVGGTDAVSVAGGQASN